jgi:hypothetical protein
VGKVMNLGNNFITIESRKLLMTCFQSISFSQTILRLEVKSKVTIEKYNTSFKFNNNFPLKLTLVRKILTFSQTNSSMALLKKISVHFSLLQLGEEQLLKIL